MDPKYAIVTPSRSVPKRETVQHPTPRFSPDFFVGIPFSFSPSPHFIRTLPACFQLPMAANRDSELLIEEEVAEADDAVATRKRELKEKEDQRKEAKEAADRRMAEAAEKKLHVLEENNLVSISSVPVVLPVSVPAGSFQFPPTAASPPPSPTPLSSLLSPRCTPQTSCVWPPRQRAHCISSFLSFRIDGRSAFCAISLLGAIS